MHSNLNVSRVMLRQTLHVSSCIAIIIFITALTFQISSTVMLTQPYWPQDSQNLTILAYHWDSWSPTYQTRGCQNCYFASHSSFLYPAVRLMPHFLISLLWLSLCTAWCSSIINFQSSSLPQYVTCYEKPTTCNKSWIFNRFFSTWWYAMFICLHHPNYSYRAVLVKNWVLKFLFSGKVVTPPKCT